MRLALPFHCFCDGFSLFVFGNGDASVVAGLVVWWPCGSADVMLGAWGQASSVRGFFVVRKVVRGFSSCHSAVCTCVTRPTVHELTLGARCWLSRLEMRPGGRLQQTTQRASLKYTVSSSRTASHATLPTSYGYICIMQRVALLTSPAEVITDRLALRHPKHTASWKARSAAVCSVGAGQMPRLITLCLRGRAVCMLVHLRLFPPLLRVPSPLFDASSLWTLHTSHTHLLAARCLAARDLALRSRTHVPPHSVVAATSCCFMPAATIEANNN